MLQHAAQILRQVHAFLTAGFLRPKVQWTPFRLRNSLGEWPVTFLKVRLN